MAMNREQKHILPQSRMNSKKNSTESRMSETDSLVKECNSSTIKQHLTGFLLGVFACFTAALGTASAQGLEVLFLLFVFLMFLFSSFLSLLFSFLFLSLYLLEVFACCTVL